MLNSLTQKKNPICPRCNNKMLIEDKEFIEKWICPKCNGIIFPLFSKCDEQPKALHLS